MNTCSFSCAFLPHCDKTQQLVLLSSQLNDELHFSLSHSMVIKCISFVINIHYQRYSHAYVVSWDHMAPPYITSISRNVKISRVALSRERDNFNRLLLSPSLIRKILSPSPYNKRIPVAEKKEFLFEPVFNTFFRIYKRERG